jgi:Fe-Mn family superoxide dismutase
MDARRPPPGAEGRPPLFRILQEGASMLATLHTYRPRSFDLGGLHGISDRTLEMHFELYEGYVENTNTLNERIDAIVRDGGLDQRDVPVYSELTRRLGFEYNGMVLHEHYFGNLKRGGGGEPERGSEFRRLVETCFGSFDVWKRDFVGIGAMRGVGWAICFQDPIRKRVSNHWVTLHEDGNVAGFQPLLVMDVWEHAFLLDYKPSERAQYIDAFFANIDWKAAEQRIVGV